jgi:hypothetical protein
VAGEAGLRIKRGGEIVERVGGTHTHTHTHPHNTERERGGVCVSLSLSLCVCVCVCVRERERERERERGEMLDGQAALCITGGSLLQVAVTFTSEVKVPA